ncbi:hypothetical protein ACLOJK_003346 [Asimina triloba]
MEDSKATRGSKSIWMTPCTLATRGVSRDGSPLKVKDGQLTEILVEMFDGGDEELKVESGETIGRLRASSLSHRWFIRRGPPNIVARLLLPADPSSPASNMVTLPATAIWELSSSMRTTA